MISFKMMYNYLFISFYKLFKRKKSNIAKFQAIGFVLIFQFFTLAIPAFIIRTTLFRNFEAQVRISKFLGLPFVLVWMFILFVYYDKERVKTLSNIYEAKSDNFKKRWILFPSLFLIFLVIIMFVGAIATKE